MLKYLIGIGLVAVLIVTLAACQPSGSEEVVSSSETEPTLPPTTEPAPTETATVEADGLLDRESVREVQVAATKAIRSEERAPTFANRATAEPTEAPQSLADYLPVLGPAPEIGNEVWINSDTPLRLEDLRGQVVLIEFWTYG